MKILKSWTPYVTFCVVDLFLTMISEWGFFLIKMLYFCSFQKYVFINSVFFFVEKKIAISAFFSNFSENFYFGIVQNSLERVLHEAGTKSNRHEYCNLHHVYMRPKQNHSGAISFRS